MNTKQSNDGWIDVLAGFFTFGASLFVGVAAGHGAGLLGWFALLDPLRFFLSPLGVYAWSSASMLLAGITVGRIQRALRWLAIALALGGMAWLTSATEARTTTIGTTIPVATIVLFYLCHVLLAERRSRKNILRTNLAEAGWCFGILAVLLGVPAWLIWGAPLLRKHRLVSEAEPILTSLEQFHKQHGRYPESFSEAAIKDPDELYYARQDDGSYIVWFGTQLGESVVFYSRDQQWR